MNFPEHPAYGLAQKFQADYPGVQTSLSFAELAKLGTSVQRAEAVRVAGHLMVCELMKHFTVRNLAAKQPAFNKLRDLLMQKHSRLRADRNIYNAADWQTVRDKFSLPTDLISKEEERIWYMALLLCTNEVVAVGPEVLKLLPEIIGSRDPAFPQSMADIAVSFFVEAMNAQGGVQA